VRREVRNRRKREEYGAKGRQTRKRGTKMAGVMGTERRGGKDERERERETVNEQIRGFVNGLLYRRVAH